MGLNAEARSRSETPEVASATPSLAPWAKEPTEAARGPSLKEIQEAEAKKAAKAEEIAAAQRRANYEQELKMLTSVATAPAPGLPTTSTWGNTASPATPTNAPSAWAKPAASKKTLADIQREEESRKQKAAAAVIAAQPAVSAGKRYADLASKVSPPAPLSGSPWSTVGAGGKVRVPTGPAASSPQPTRAVSSANVSTASAPRVTKPAATVRSATGPAGANAAKEEFVKWAKATLSNGLNSDINVDEFVITLMALPAEAGIIADSIYASSKLLNGNDFAVEFLRRRGLSDKGIIEPANNGSGLSGDKSGGWNEVAKKGPPKEEPTAGFKVVPNKKKGRK